MKKTLLYFIILLIIVGILPMIGNKIVEYYVEKEIKEVRSKGINLILKSEKTSYLYTSREYEFMLSDVEAFTHYLTKYDAGMLPPYTEELLKSIVFRVDMKYHNIPFLESISIDIYPIDFSKKIINIFKENGNIFFKKFENFIGKQGILYHIDYNLLRENYTGYIKDVDYQEKSSDGSNVVFTLHHALFNGSGSFSTLKSLKMNIDRIILSTSGKLKDTTVEIHNFSSISSIFMGKKPEDSMGEVYDTSMNMNSIIFNVKDKDLSKMLTLEVENADVNISLEQENKKLKNKSYIIFESLNLKTKEVNLEMSELLYSVSMSNIDTVSFREFQSLLAQAKSSSSVDVLNNLKVSAINLLSHGLKIQVPELSVQNINFKGEDFGGLKLILAFNIKEDKSLAAKMLFSPLFIVKNIDFKVQLKVSKKIYATFVKEVPLALLAMIAIKQTKNDLIYNISYINGNLKINGNPILN